MSDAMLENVKLDGDRAILEFLAQQGRQLKDTEAQLKRLNKQGAKQTASQDRQNQLLQEQNSAIKTVGESWKLTMAGVYGVLAVYDQLVAKAGQMYNVAMGGAKAIDTQNAFLLQQHKQWIDINAVASELDNTLGEMELQKLMNLARTLKVPTGQMAQLARVAKGASVALGETMPHMMESLMVALGRGSKLILDNLGIIYNAEQAEISYAVALGKIRDELTDTEKKQAMVNDIVGQFDDGMLGLTANIKRNTSAFEAGKVSIENFGMAIKKQLADPFGNARRESELLEHPMNRIVKAMENQKKVIEEVEQAQRVHGEVADWQLKRLETARIEYAQLNEELELHGERYIHLAKITGEVDSAFAGMGNQYADIIVKSKEMIEQAKLQKERYAELFKNLPQGTVYQAEYNEMIKQLEAKLKGATTALDNTNAAYGRFWNAITSGTDIEALGGLGDIIKMFSKLNNEVDEIADKIDKKLNGDGDKKPKTKPEYSPWDTERFNMDAQELYANLNEYHDTVASIEESKNNEHDAMMGAYWADRAERAKAFREEFIAEDDADTELELDNHYEKNMRLWEIDQKRAADQKKFRAEGIKTARMVTMEAIKYQKQLAIIMAAWELGQAIGAFATYRYWEGTQHLLASAQYGVVAGKSFASSGSGSGAGSGASSSKGGYSPASSTPSRGEGGSQYTVINNYHTPVVHDRWPDHTAWMAKEMSYSIQRGNVLPLPMAQG